MNATNKIFPSSLFSVPGHHVSSGDMNFIKRSVVWVMVVIIPVLLSSAISCEKEAHGMTDAKHVVLLGASVGHDWKIESLPERLKPVESAQKYRLEYVGEYDFDKTKPLMAILQRKENKPDAIIIKECAAYYPGNLRHYQELMQGWVKECRNAGVVPIPTTVVPVISSKNKKIVERAKDFIKSLLGRPTTASQLEDIFQYNDWVRKYAAQEGLTVLDLEAALRTSQDDRSLRVDLHSGDGLHLNSKAYEILDAIVVPTLDRTFLKN
jgi:hypothetical protein